MTEPETSVQGIIQAFAESALNGEKAALATVIKSHGLPPVGAKMLVTIQGQSLSNLDNSSLEELVFKECSAAIKDGKPKTVSLTIGKNQQMNLELFIDVAVARPSLLIIGAGHISQSLAKIGKLIGFQVIILDDRPEYANVQRFPDADNVIAADFTETLKDYPITNATYIIIVTRGHRYDEQSLRQVINSQAVYIGMVGSRRRVTTVLRHLADEGYPQEQVLQVYSPIGLDIGSETPQEIAVSIIAEIINVMRGGHAQSLALRTL